MKTLSEVLQYMAPFAGGSIPSETSQEYQNWVRWVQWKQEEFAKRGFWRRLLKKEVITFDNDKVMLPNDFHKANGLYVWEVDGVDWTYEDDPHKLFVGYDNGWYVLFDKSYSGTANVWYFAAPPTPTQSSDIIVLPADMVAYAALAEYYRTTGAEGSMDQANIDAENRFNSYLTLEMIPSKWELISFNKNSLKKWNRAKSRYATRPDRG